jgi:hypothetical protein
MSKMPLASLTLACVAACSSASQVRSTDVEPRHRVEDLDWLLATLQRDDVYLERCGSFAR